MALLNSFIDNNRDERLIITPWKELQMKNWIYLKTSWYMKNIRHKTTHCEQNRFIMIIINKYKWTDGNTTTCTHHQHIMLAIYAHLIISGPLLIYSFHPLFLFLKRHHQQLMLRPQPHNLSTPSVAPPPIQLMRKLNIQICCWYGLHNIIIRQAKLKH